LAWVGDAEVARGDVTREEYRSVVRTQLVLMAIWVVLLFGGVALFGTWAGIGATTVWVIALAVWRKRHLELITRLKRRRPR
jgi:hypothetical protein